MLILIVTTSIIGCKEDGRVVAPELEPFIGSWAMESVTLEGTLLEEWQQVVITFERESEEGGTYSIPNSPDHLVWHPEGVWSIEEKAVGLLSFVMNDTSNVTVVTYDEETMTLARGLPWTSYNPCDLNDPNVEACVLPVYGTWLFFMREEQ